MLLLETKNTSCVNSGGYRSLFFFFLNGKSLFMKMWGNWNSWALLHAFSMENNVAIPESSNDRITIWRFHSWAYIKRTQIVDSCFYTMLIAVLFTTDKQEQYPSAHQEMTGKQNMVFTYNRSIRIHTSKNKLWYIHRTDHSH